MLSNIVEYSSLNPERVKKLARWMERKLTLSQYDAMSGGKNWSGCFNPTDFVEDMGIVPTTLEIDFVVDCIGAHSEDGIHTEIHYTPDGSEIRYVDFCFNSPEPLPESIL